MTTGPVTTGTADGAAANVVQGAGADGPDTTGAPDRNGEGNATPADGPETPGAPDQNVEDGTGIPVNAPETTGTPDQNTEDGTPADGSETRRAPDQKAEGEQDTPANGPEDIRAPDKSVEGEQDTPANGSVDTGPRDNGVRPRPDDGKDDNGERPTQKPKVDGQPSEDAQQPQANPCDTWSQRIQGPIAAMARDSAEGRLQRGQYADPVPMRSDLEDDATFRSIAAVTEAIGRNGGTIQFSLINNNDWQTMLLSQADVGIMSRIVRPERELLLPLTGNGHTSLMAILRDDNAPGDEIRFTAHMLDSAPRFSHGRLGATPGSPWDQFERAIQRGGWRRPGSTLDANAVAPVANNRLAIRQAGNWECGIHTILHAWTLALGLQLPQNTAERRNLPTGVGNFLDNATQMIRLAVLGHLDSAIIEAFLKCFGFAAMDSTTPPNRAFGATVAFPTNNEYVNHVAVQRLEDELQVRRGAGPSPLPRSVQEAVDTINRTDIVPGGVLRFAGLTLDTLLTKYDLAASILAQQVVDNGSRENSPVDEETRLALERSLQDAANQQRGPDDGGEE